MMLSNAFNFIEQRVEFVPGVVETIKENRPVYVAENVSLCYVIISQSVL